jgi:hypothetical protein
MAVFKSEALVTAADGAPLGAGMAYLHLPRGLEREQDAGGTVSLRSWTAVTAEPALLQLVDGRHLPINVSRDALSDCSRNRVLRFTLHWPGA